MTDVCAPRTDFYSGAPSGRALRAICRFFCRGGTRKGHAASVRLLRRQRLRSYQPPIFLIRAKHTSVIHHSLLALSLNQIIFNAA